MGRCGLGARQREILEWVATKNRLGTKPTRRDVADELFLSDTSANEAVRTLIERGRLRATGTSPEGLEVVTG